MDAETIAGVGLQRTEKLLKALKTFKSPKAVFNRSKSRAKTAKTDPKTKTDITPNNYL
jgi:hypothetical protein